MFSMDVHNDIFLLAPLWQVTLLCVHPYTHPRLPSFTRANSKEFCFHVSLPWQLAGSCCCGAVASWNTRARHWKSRPADLPRRPASIFWKTRFGENLSELLPDAREGHCVCVVCMWRPGSTSSLLWVWWSLAWTRLLYSELKFTLLA